MGTMVAGLASSHAFTFLDPAEWDDFRDRNRAGYRRRYGVDPPVHPKLAQESAEENRHRFRRVQEGLALLRERLAQQKLDALVVIGDDQDENYREENLPQLAMYLGDEVLAVDRLTGERRPYPCHAELAWELYRGGVEAGFDLACSKSFPQGELLSHAHGPPLKVLTPEGGIPIVFLFVNAIHLPAVSPDRCYRLGQTIRKIVEAGPDRRVAVYASGGLSHFTAGYPWAHYRGPETYGGVCEEFDRKALELMTQGRGGELAKLTSDDLLEHGDIEMRSWITLLGCVGETPARVLAYEPFYRALMGMAVAYWAVKEGRP